MPKHAGLPAISCQALEGRGARQLGPKQLLDDARGRRVVWSGQVARSLFAMVSAACLPEVER